MTGNLDPRLATALRKAQRNAAGQGQTAECVSRGVIRGCRSGFVPRAFALVYLRPFRSESSVGQRLYYA